LEPILNEPLLDIVNRFEQLRVLVVGDVMLDGYLAGQTHRLCPEAPVPVVDLQHRAAMPGGAANTAANLQALGARTTLVSVMGDDGCGRRLRELLEEQGVDTDPLLTSRLRQTLSKRRILADGQLLARLDEGTIDPISRDEEGRLIDSLDQFLRSVDLVVVSDYGYGVMTDVVIDRLSLSPLIRHCGEEGKNEAHGPFTPVIVDSKQPQRYRPLGPLAVKPNYAQLQELLPDLPKADAARWKYLRERGPQILEATGAEIAAVTLDRDGALIFTRTTAPHRTFAQPSPQMHAAGAGDTFLAAFALALAAGASPAEAGEIATAAAAVVVGKPHTAVCSQVELRQRLQGDSISGKLAALAPVLEEYRRRGQRIVFTNGCFDILHPGHVAYLQQAKMLGDVLIVGINSDASIRRLKGPDRPINALEDRLKVLAALSCIDHLVSFEEDTPHRLIETVRPDVFVKGGDYTREMLGEADLVEQLGGSVKILPFLDGRSTTGIISRITALHAAVPAPSPS
jgi:D-beta-D-heptose 7-phosphate kinase/D-beta-D-heptose 1-phosphate adenosyltransferase